MVFTSVGVAILFLVKKTLYIHICLFFFFYLFNVFLLLPVRNSIWNKKNLNVFYSNVCVYMFVCMIRRVRARVRESMHRWKHTFNVYEMRKHKAKIFFLLNWQIASIAGHLN